MPQNFLIILIFYEAMGVQICIWCFLSKTVIDVYNNLNLVKIEVEKMEYFLSIDYKVA